MASIKFKGVVNPDVARRAFRLAHTKRHDFVLMSGDSTISTDSGGKAKAWVDLLNEKCGMFSTGTLPAKDNNGSGLTLNTGWASLVGGVADAMTGAGTFHNKINQRTTADLPNTPVAGSDVPGGHHSRYSYAGSAFAASVGYGFTLSGKGAGTATAHGLDMQGPLQFSIWHAEGPSVSAGRFTPQMRHNGDGYGSYTDLSGAVAQVNCNAGADATRRTTVAIAADSARDARRDIICNFANILQNQGVTNPCVFYSGRVTQTNRLKGAAFSIFEEKGGASTYDFARRFDNIIENGVSGGSLSETFKHLMTALFADQDDAGQARSITCIWDGLGFNSYSEGAGGTDWGGGGLSNPTVAGEMANWQNMWDRFETHRVRMGLDSSIFTHILLTGTRVKTDTAKEDGFDAYRKAYCDWAKDRGNVCVVDWSDLMTIQESQDWGQSGGTDEVHWVKANYLTLFRRFYDAVMGFEARKATAPLIAVGAIGTGR